MPVSRNRTVRVQRTTGREPTGILAFFDTLPRGPRHAKFTMPRQESRKGRYAFDGRSSSVDFLPMTLRTRFLITALFLCHHLLASALVTSQLLSENSAQSAVPSSPKAPQKAKTAASALSTPCAKQAATQDSRLRDHLRRRAGKSRRRLQIARQRRNSLSHLHPARR